MTFHPERHSLGAYITTFFPRMLFAPHHNTLIDAMSRVEAGKLKRVIISVPPRHGKSLIVSDHFPAWAFGKDPSRQIAVASYGQDLSESFGKKVQTQIESEEYQTIFPELKTIKATQREINTTKRGVYVATSIGGSLTGKGADILIIDDPVKDRQDAESQKKRDTAWEWYTSTARTRLMPGGAIVVVLTRWHDDDLAGRILKNDKKGEWEYIRIPAINEAGEALWPEMFDKDALLSIKADIGAYEFQALYQNDPKPKEGNVLPVNHIQYCKELPEKFDRVIQVVDSAIKDKKENDYTVINTLGMSKGNIYEIDQWRGKVKYAELKRMVHLNYAKHKPSVIVVEDKASGQQLIQELSVKLPIKPASAVLDKVQRSGTLSDYMAVGRIYLQEGLERNNITVAEMAGFPNCANDDIVDTWAYGAMELCRAEILPLIGDIFIPKVHILDLSKNPPFAWRRFRSLCYSPQEPTAALWWAVASDENNYCDRFWIDSQIIIFAEKIWNKGSTPEHIADQMRQMENAMGWAVCGAGPAGSDGDVPIWGDDGSPSPIMAFSKKGVKFVKAIEDEPTGWAQVRSRLHENDLIINQSCEALIDQIQYTTANPDKKEYADGGQIYPALKTLRFICNAYKRRPIKEQSDKIDVKKSFKTILGGRTPHATV